MNNDNDTTCYIEDCTNSIERSKITLVLPFQGKLYPYYICLNCFKQKRDPITGAFDASYTQVNKTLDQLQKIQDKINEG